MIIDCISDLHGHYPKLEGGDLLIVAGDLTASDSPSQYLQFYIWLHKQNYRRYVVVAGNHDNLLEKENGSFVPSLVNTNYLCDSGTEFEGLKIWGSPWTQWFHGVNPACKAFMLSSEEKLAKKWTLIPDDTDILVTHSPPYGARDRANRHNAFGYDCVGGKSLQMRCLDLNLKLWVVGHIHESYGMEHPGGGYGGIDCKLLNASHINERYQPVNPPIRIIL